MVIIMKAGATAKEIGAVMSKIESLSYQAHPIYGEERVVIGVVGNDRPLDRTVFDILPGVETTLPILKPFKLASRDFKHDNTVVTVGANGQAVKIGGPDIVVIAGPCAVESREQILESAHARQGSRGHGLAAAAHSSRARRLTAFQGMGEEGLQMAGRGRARRPGWPSSPR